jgi:predicted DCC family thiol-disulfide oxidoreductase YuxK
MSTKSTNRVKQPFILFHDGQCPLCQAEVLLLQHRSESGAIKFVDVNTEEFGTASPGVSRARALAVLHGRIGDRPPITGVDAFTEAYKRSDLKFLSWALSRRWLRPILKAAYRVFAANRHVVSRLVGPAVLALMKRRYRHADNIARERG